jgi:type I restriction enzyme S subunit
LGALNCFAVKHTDVSSSRCDCDYHHPEFQSLLAQIEKLPNTATISEIVRLPLLSGFAAGKDNRTVESENVALQIRPTQILTNGEIDLADAYSVEIKDMPEQDYLTIGEVLFNNTNSSMWVGKSAVFFGDSKPVVCSNHITRLRLHENIQPEFVCEVLNTFQRIRYFARLCTNFNNQAGVNSKVLTSVRIPLPPMSRRTILTNQMNTSRALRKAKLAEADALLNGIDGYVLDALGISQNPPQRRIFATRSGHVKGGRGDPDFHSLRFQTIRRGIEHGIYPSRTIAEICGLIASGFAAGRQDQAFDFGIGVPHLRPLNLNIRGEISLQGTKFVPKTVVGKTDYCQIGEVLFNNTNSTEMVGKSAVFDLEQACACSNHMTRLRPNKGIDAEYLAAVLNAMRSLGFLGLLSTNFNNQAGINAVTLAALKLPCPPPSIQQTIATEALRRRDEARKLRAEAEQLWQQAKAQFEAALLGDLITNP